MAAHGDGVAADNRHTHTGAGDLQLGQVHDLPALILHLHFLAGVAIALLTADLGNQVVGDLVGEHLGLIGLTLPQGLHLVLKLDGAACAGTGHSLIGGGSHGADGSQSIQRIDRRNGNDGGAVGVSDDAAVPGHVLGVDLGHDQGHLGIQPEGRGIIHKHSTGLHDGGSELLGNVILRCAQHDIHALKGLVPGFLNGYLFIAPLQCLACASCAGQRNQLANREIALLENLHHFLSHGAGGTQNGNGILFHSEFLQSFTSQSCYTAPGWRKRNPGYPRRR